MIDWELQEVKHTHTHMHTHTAPPLLCIFNHWCPFYKVPKSPSLTPHGQPLHVLPYCPNWFCTIPLHCYIRIVECTSRYVGVNPPLSVGNIVTHLSVPLPLTVDKSRRVHSTGSISQPQQCVTVRTPTLWTRPLEKQPHKFWMNFFFTWWFHTREGKMVGSRTMRQNPTQNWITRCNIEACQQNFT